MMFDWAKYTIGDTFQYSGSAVCTIARIDTVYMGSMPLKRMLPAIPFDTTLYTRGYVEGVGLTAWPCSGNTDRAYFCYRKQGQTLLFGTKRNCDTLFPEPIYTRYHIGSPTVVRPTVPAIGLQIYPNPAVHQVQITTGIALPGTVSIGDMLGRRLVQCSYPGNSITLSVALLPPGIYCVTTTQCGVSRQARLVKL
jgi:hypothetical protein